MSEPEPTLEPRTSAAASTTLLVLERLALDVGISLDRARARRTLAEMGPTPDLDRVATAGPVRLISQIGEELHVPVRELFLTVAEAWELLQGGATLATWGAPATHATGWRVVRRANRHKALLWTPEQGERWIAREDLPLHLGVAVEEQPVAWLTVQPASPICLATLDAEHADGFDEHHVSPLSRLVHLLRPDRGDIGIVALFSIVVGLLALATPVAVESLVNTVAFGRFVQPLLVICLMLLIFLGFAAAIRVLQTYIAELIQRRLFVRVVADLSYRLPRVRQDALDRDHLPELMNRFFDVMTVQKSAALLVLDGIAIVLQTLIGMAVLAFYHPILFGFDIFLLASLAFAVFALGRGAVATAIAESREKYAVAAWLEELARVPTTFKGVDGPRRALERADTLTSKYLLSRQRHFHVLLRQITFTLGLQAVGGSLLLGLAGWLVLQGQLTLGQLVAAELIVAVILGSFAKLGKHMESFYDLLAAVNKVGHLLDLPMERNTGEAALAGRSGADVKVSRAELSLAEGPGLSAISLRVHSGEMVALVGAPGSGKSLLLDLLYGLREPAQGYVTIDGADLRSLAPAGLRREVTLVRGIELLPGSLAENVHLERDGVGSAAVRRALREVGLWDEVLELPSGVQTVLQPHGTPLSHSQLLRLMLARALARPPRLLLVDGLLDSLSDEALPTVMAAFRRMLPGCTVVIATGRSDVWRLCDRVISLDAPGEAAATDGSPAAGSRDVARPAPPPVNPTHHLRV